MTTSAKLTRGLDYIIKNNAHEMSSASEKILREAKAWIERHASDAGEAYGYHIPGTEGSNGFFVLAKDADDFAKKCIPVYTHPAPTAPASDVTQTLVRQLIERDAKGRAKYGKTLDRKDLAREEWLQHLIEELLDAAGYAEAAKRAS